jgi:hypothetical protein
MDELRQALSAIDQIRGQVARGTQFRGYGPRSIAFSGLLALAVAAGQSAGGGHLKQDLTENLCVWISTAAVALAVSGIETIRRAHRVHVDFARAMLLSAAEQFLPALAVGTLLTIVFVRLMPDEGWLLPGLWQLVFSLGIFASCRFLPRLMFLVGVWYLLAGLCSIVLCGEARLFLPWAMGVAFGVGQLLVATVLTIASRGHDVEVE